MTQIVQVYHTFKLAGWREGKPVAENPERVGIFMDDEGMAPTTAAVIETSHGYNGTAAAFQLLGLTIADGAPALPHKGLDFIKIYGSNGMTPMNLDAFLAAFPIIEASEGFVNTFKRKLERSSASVAEDRTSREAQRAAKLAKREAKRQAKSGSRSTPSASRPERAERATRAEEPELVSGEGQEFTHSYIDNVTAKAALEQVVRRFASNKVDAFFTGTSTVCKYIDPASGKKKAHEGPYTFDEVRITDLGRVWMTINEPIDLKEAKNKTWFLKVISPGATIVFRVTA